MKVGVVVRLKVMVVLLLSPVPLLSGGLSGGRGERGIVVVLVVLVVKGLSSSSSSS